jgi:hypothetical protein
MGKLLLIFLILINLVSCATTTRKTHAAPASKPIPMSSVDEIIKKAEDNSTEAGKKILETSREMISNKEVIVGGCWNYINTVYDRVGYSSKERTTVYKSKLKGPYVDADIIQPGDWLYFVNHTYGESEHSAIFVGWINEKKKEALMISYVGEKHKKPATYKTYVLDNIYNVIRGSGSRDIASEKKKPKKAKLER